MINQVFAQNFVRKMNRQMDLKVNVMNEKGVIIASAAPERVGDFHMCAYEIIEQGLNLSITEKPTRDLIGVNAPGVNMRLVNNNETIGVIGVTGEPDKVLNLARMVKLTFETMYEYEYKRKMQANTRDALSSFAYALFLETPVNAQHIARNAKKLGLKDNFPRIPVYISIFTEQSVLSYMEWHASCSLSHPQDILLPLDGGLLVCKAWDRPDIPPDVRGYADTYIEESQKGFFRSAGTGQDAARFHVVPVQSCFADYHKIYPYLQFILRGAEDSSETVCHLSDHLLPLILHEGSGSIRPLLSYYCSLVENHMDKEQFLETVAGLVRADMKVEAAAAGLHLHKNSVFARLKKIKDVLHLNPLSGPRDAVLLMAVYEMLREAEYS